MFCCPTPVRRARLEKRQSLVALLAIAAIFLYLVQIGGGHVYAQEGDQEEQEAVVQLEITALETGEFPDIFLDLNVTDGEGLQVTDLTGLALQEDDTPIESFSTEQASVGVNLIFVIDANASIESQDDDTGLSRLEKVRDSIVRYANRYMTQGEDQVSIVVPDAEGGRFLDRQGMTFPNEVINAINFYETGELADTPLNQMLETALAAAEDDQESGRIQAIYLFSDGAQLSSQLDFDTLVARAEDAGVAFFGSILGGRADPNEIENVTLLTDPTGGEYIHMPAATDADPVYERIKMRAARTRVRYRSSLNSAGRHTVVVNLAGSSAEAMFDLSIQAPEIVIVVDNSQPIRRVANAEDTPLSEMEPTAQPLVAEVTWPDGFPRLLTSANLLVDGQEVPLDSPVLDSEGLLTLEWDISNRDEGTYELQIQVEDELGLQGTSESLPLTIAIERPAPAATATVPPTAVPTPAPEPSTADSVVDRLRENLTLIIVGLVALVGLFLLAFAVLAIIRRRRAARAAPDLDATLAALSETGPSDVTLVSGSRSGQADVDETFLMPPDFALSAMGGAYLEPLEYAAEHTSMVPLIGSNIALGRDQNLVQIAFNDRSVSRLHARIMETGGSYRLYDEGSASGTYLNYERIGLTPRALKDKDEIHFGRVHLRFHLASGDAPDDQTQILDLGDQDDETDTQVYIP